MPSSRPDSPPAPLSSDLRDAPDPLDDLIGARLEAVRPALDAVPNVLGLALDRTALAAQGGRAPVARTG
jgi:hypothetical protein